MIQSFLNWLEIEKNYSKKTVVEYGYDLNMFNRFINTNILLTKKDDVRGFLWHLTKNRKQKPTTISRKLATLKSFFNFCRREGKIIENPMEFIERLKLPERQAIYLNDEERFLIFEHARKLTFTARGKRNFAIINLLYYCGLRVSELIGINFSSIQKEDGRIFLKFVGKGNKERLVPLNKEAATILNIWLESRPSTAEGEEAVFTGITTNKRLTQRSVQLLIKDIAGKVGITKNITPHKFRHTFGTKLLQQGANLVDIQTLLGHRSLNTTRIYTHTNQTNLRNAVDRL